VDRKFFHELNKKWDMGFCILSVRRMYISSSLSAATREFARYKIDLVGVQEVRWDKKKSKSRGL
jgi:hypothetical protein